jgi:hypothetical protein
VNKDPKDRFNQEDSFLGVSVSAGESRIIPPDAGDPFQAELAAARRRRAVSAATGRFGITTPIHARSSRPVRKRKALAS